MQRVGVTEDGESVGALWGIDPGFDCYTICGSDAEPLGHGRSLKSQTAKATRMTTASAALAINNQRVCMPGEGNWPAR